MRDDWQDALASLVDEGDEFFRDARSAAQVSVDHGSDATKSVTVTLDARGRAVAVRVAAR